MEFEIYITLEDYLQYQLYLVSKSPKVKLKRWLTRWTIALVYLLLAMLLFYKTQNAVVIIFIVFAFIWFFGYPAYFRYQHKKHYTDFFNKKFGSEKSKKTKIIITENLFISVGEDGESKIKLSEIAELIELLNQFFIVLKSGMTLIIPKNAVEERELFLEKILKAGGKHKSELFWRWK